LRARTNIAQQDESLERASAERTTRLAALVHPQRELDPVARVELVRNATPA
jgi:hypothetical protein